MGRVRSGYRGIAVGMGVVLAMLLGVGSAAAHVEVTVEPAQAGARDAVVTFTAESESDTAGISAVRVELPAGIGPADVTLASGPPGWVLAAIADGFTVAGPPLPVGEDARYAVKVKQLPDASSVAFKTLQSYTDGTIDRWIGLSTPGAAEPDNPAPVATLAPATAGASDPATPASSTPAVVEQAQPASPAAPSAGGVPVGVWVGLAVLAVAVAVGMVVLAVRRRRANAPAGGGTGG